MRIAGQGARVVVVLCLGIMGVSGCAGVTTGPMPARTASSGTPRIPIEVQKPAGPGPFPAVVIAHDCSGLGPTSSGAPGRWARELVSRGYVAIIPDSFSTRGVGLMGGSHGGSTTLASRSTRRAGEHLK